MIDTLRYLVFWLVHSVPAIYIYLYTFSPSRENTPRFIFQLEANASLDRGKEVSQIVVKDILIQNSKWQTVWFDII